MKRYHVEVEIECPSNWTLTQTEDYVKRQLLSSPTEIETLEVSEVTEATGPPSEVSKAIFQSIYKAQTYERSTKIPAGG